MDAKTKALVEAARARVAAKRIAEHNAATPAGTLSAMSWATKPTIQATSPSGQRPVNTVVDASKVAHVFTGMQDSAKDNSFLKSKLTFNKEQQAAIELGLQGKSFCLIGPAGSGKTTVTQELITRLQRASHMSPLATATKHLDKDAPGLVIVGYTNKAVNNIRKKLPPHLQKHCITIHKLLEYAPVYYEVPDADSKDGFKTTMRFEASRNGANPLPHISTIITEEASMVGTELHEEVLNALPFPSRTQMIYLGDLNQLPPVFGPSILGFKLAELPTIELVEIYRQALLSPIISLATAIRTNAVTKLGFVKQPAWHETDTMTLPIKLSEPVEVDRGEHGKLSIRPWKKRVDSDNATAMMAVFLPKLIESGAYNPQEDMILCPFNKSFGTIELNKIIADYLGKKRDEEVFEVIARYEKSYWAVGDRVMVDRHEAIIKKIVPTVGYYGKMPQPNSKKLNRWGVNSEHPEYKAVERTADEVLNALDALAGDTDDDAKNLASHTITVYLPDLDKEEILNTAGTINKMIFGYALTVHKSQGSEWERVFLFLHGSHATMLSRELVYTAVTRAKHELSIICEGDLGKYTNSVARAADMPVIPGTLLSEKIAYFNGKSMPSKGQ